MIVRVGVLTSLALALVFASTGCANNKTNAERDGLLSQNDQLKKELDAERRARQEADARANMAAAQATPAPIDQQVAPPSMEGGALDLSAGAPGVTPRTPTPAARGNRAPAGSSGNISGVSSRRNAAGELVLEIPGDVLFDSGKATLKPSAKKTLDGIASNLKSNHAGHQIRIEGHTDPAPVKKTAWDDNWDLGAARANAVRSYLSEKGVKNMYIASFAATELKNAKNPALNRRVEIVVVQNAK
jgi:flagellar motor protein MotB